MRSHICGWFRPTASAARLTIRSEAYELRSHFVPGFGSARCQEAACELCSRQGEPKTTLVHVVERSGQMFLLELNADAVERPLIVGDVVVIQRRKLGSFAETFLRRDGSESVERVWPHNYLAAIGQKAYDRSILASTGGG